MLQGGSSSSSSSSSSPVVGVGEFLDDSEGSSAGFMVFTLIVTVLLLSQMSQLDLEEEIRRLSAVVSATAPSSAAPTPWRY